MFLSMFRLQMKKKKVILFTGSFPYAEAKEDGFIMPELPILSEKFEKVVIVPLSATGSLVSLQDYKNINTDTNLFNHYFQTTLLRKFYFVLSSLFSIQFIIAIYYDKTFLSFKKIGRTLSEFYRARCVKKWLQQFFKSVTQEEEYILYTYWFNYATLGSVLFKHPCIKMRVTRCHRFDLYDSKVNFRSTYFRKFVLEKITQVYTVSKEGRNYLQNKFPAYSNKIDCVYLGINGKGIRNIIPVSGNNHLYIFSCSYMVPVKRNNLLAHYIIALADKFPNCFISWEHAGGGPLLEEVKNIVQQADKKNLNAVFWGIVDNKQILEHYSNDPVDVFVSLTESEGLPVSMMEAQSFGVPIVSTNVGGVSEIVLDKKTGFLLNENPTLEEFIDVMSFFITSGNKVENMRENSYQNWLDNFNAKTNHSTLSEKIVGNNLNLVKSK